MSERKIKDNERERGAEKRQILKGFYKKISLTLLPLLHNIKLNKVKVRETDRERDRENDRERDWERETEKEREKERDQDR